nr:sulfotransferase 5 [Vargula tsujii]
MADLPFTLEEFEVAEESRLKVRVQPGNFTLYAGYKQLASRIYNIKFRSGDVVLMSTPKSGTHWAAEMLWNIINQVDIEAAKKDLLFRRVPMLEISHIDAEKTEELKEKKAAGENLLPIEETVIFNDSIETFEKLPSPRICYTHLPFILLPPNILEVCKIVYITRNPADVIVSYHPFMAAGPNFDVNFENFFKMFLDGTALFTPYWSSVKEAWKRKDHPNMLFLLYEEMKQDLRGCIKNVSKHLQRPLTGEQVDRLEDHLSFESMKSNSSVNMKHLAGSAFFSKDGQLCRKGQIGDSLNTLSDDQKKQMKEWCDANRGDCNITFPGLDQ